MDKKDYNANKGELNSSHYKNLKLLYKLRWLAISGQSLAIILGYYIFSLQLPVIKLVVIVGAQIIINIITFYWYKIRVIKNSGLFLQLLLDIITLILQLYYSGGFANPFINLFLIQVIIAAIILSPTSTWFMVLITILAYVFLANFYTIVPNLNHSHGDSFFNLHLQGMLISYIISSVLVAYFVVGMAKNLKERDQKLAKIREDKLREENFLKIGMFAANAAHELGTPLSTIAIINNEVVRQYNLDEYLTNNMLKIDNQVKRCKQVIDEVLLVAGDVRGQFVIKDQLHNFMTDLLEKWSENKFQGNLSLNMDKDLEGLPIVIDKTFAQSVVNLLNNAYDAGSENITIILTRNKKHLIINIKDDGIGVPDNLLSLLGREIITSTSGGRGVGLVITTMVINRMGGNIYFNKGKPKGFIVRMELPFSALKANKG